MKRCLLAFLLCAGFLPIFAWSSCYTLPWKTGPGSTVPATDPLVPNKPDFIIDRSRLFNGGMTEQYVFHKTDTLCMEAKIKNIGAGKIGNSDRVKTKFMLSKGYKEDAHGDWKSIGSFDTRGDHVEQGESNTETVCVSLANRTDILPGHVYNIIPCADRIEDNNNNGGAYAEEHENNNCSTETVFEVLVSYDFAVSSANLSKTSYIEGEDLVLNGIVRNLGDAAISSIPITFSVFPQAGNDAMTTSSSSLSPDSLPNGATVSVASSNMVAPSAGAYTARICINEYSLSSEVNPSDNCKAVNFTVEAGSISPPLPTGGDGSDDDMTAIINWYLSYKRQHP